MKIKFENAQDLHEKYPDTFDAPSAEELQKIRPGSVVKVCAFRERFWAIVLSVNDGTITAKIDNNLLTPHLRYNQEITFKPEHVHDIYRESKHAPEVCYPEGNRGTASNK